MVSKKPDDNEIRSIAVDRESNVWIATASGVFKKEPGKKEWEEVIIRRRQGTSIFCCCKSQG